uniref:Uncharacterized protein n=1 Tax=Anguilla anguilla TaxID=7936 RepID=A0A0E9T458_ANGAN
MTVTFHSYGAFQYGSGIARVPDTGSQVPERLIYKRCATPDDSTEW